MGGLTIEMVINNYENLTITTTLTQEDDGHLEQNGVVISGELSKKLVNLEIITNSFLCIWIR